MRVGSLACLTLALAACSKTPVGAVQATLSDIPAEIPSAALDVLSDGMAAMCFLPRHGIRAERGARTLDLLICYECLQLEVHGTGDPRAQITTSASPEPSVSALFRAHGLSIHGD